MNKPLPLKPRTLLWTALIALAASFTLAFSRPATIEIDGQSLISDVPPVTANHQAYVPLRALTAGLGAQISYTKSTGSISVAHGADHLKLRIGERKATLNGRLIKLSAAPFTVRGRTMVATRTIERALGPKVRYNARKAAIDVYTTDTSVAADQDDSSTSDAF
ncbi:MAG: copper amine oxidase N-terminal domain-containing protein [Vulcanimicrobiaceae bacterium]|jgi:hypothetical protein